MLRRSNTTVRRRNIGPPAHDALPQHSRSRGPERRLAEPAPGQHRPLPRLRRAAHRNLPRRCPEITPSLAALLPNDIVARRLADVAGMQHAAEDLFRQAATAAGLTD